MNRELYLPRDDWAGSGPVYHLVALKGGSTYHTGRLRSDDRCISGSGRPRRQGEGL